MIVSVTITDSREAEISDAVRSVVSHVDRVLIVDTGITDDTLKRAFEIAGDKIAVVAHAWVDFSAARNLGLAAARALGAEWIVIVDSDERLNFGDLNLRAELANVRADVVLIDSDDGHYPKEKIVRASARASFVGPTHETLRGGEREQLRGATFSELPKSREQLTRKFTRDVALLSDHTEKNPEDGRWWYYLGASHEGLGNHARAAKAFGECVERRRTTGDEAAWAAYKQAEQLFILNRFDESIAACARGLQANAAFAECAWLAAVAATRLGRPDQAIAWARISEAVGRYKGCGQERAFFRHLPALYELPYDVLRFALPDGPGRAQAEADFHSAKLARIGVSSAEDLDRAGVLKSAPKYQRLEARFMLRPPPLSKLCPSARSARIKFIPPDGRRPMNPSVTWHNGEIWCVVRAVNYTIDCGRYHIDDADGVVRTENYLGRLGPNDELCNARLMRDFDDTPRQPSQIVGYEDIRLVSIEQDGKRVLTGSATVCDVDPQRRMIARLHLDADGDVQKIEVQNTNQTHEKNWMPLSVSGEFAWIYSFDPTAVLPGPLRQCPFHLEHLRGGAVTPLEDGYLCVGHESIDTGGGRIYLHRFVLLDSKFNVTGVSPAWVFEHHGIEFAAGILCDGDQVLISYGVDDKEACTMRVSIDDLENLSWIDPGAQIAQRVKASIPVKPARASSVRLNISVVNSQHERCGVREYGLQLSRALAQAGTEISEQTYENFTPESLISSDVALVHYEDGLVSRDFYQKLWAAKQGGAKIVFCCHRYEAASMGMFFPLVDRFVLHRSYPDARNSVEIPLGCPVYEPADSRDQVRIRLGLPENKIIVTSLGFLAPWKRWAEVVETVARELSDKDVFLQIHTASPFSMGHQDFEREARAIAPLLLPDRGRHSTEFLSERDLLDRVYASDLGFVFHPIHTGSVSAATKQFVSGRCPLVVTGSSHASDLKDGVLRVASLDPRDLAREIRGVVTNEIVREQLRQGAETEYARLNMDAVAFRYLTLFKEIA